MFATFNSANQETHEGTELKPRSSQRTAGNILVKASPKIETHPGTKNSAWNQRNKLILHKSPGTLARPHRSRIRFRSTESRTQSPPTARPPIPDQSPVARIRPRKTRGEEGGWRRLRTAGFGAAAAGVPEVAQRAMRHCRDQEQSSNREELKERQARGADACEVALFYTRACHLGRCQCAWVSLADGPFLGPAPRVQSAVAGGWAWRARWAYQQFRNLWLRLRGGTGGSGTRMSADGGVIWVSQACEPNHG